MSRSDVNTRVVLSIGLPVVAFVADRLFKNIVWFTPPRGVLAQFVHPVVNKAIAFSLELPVVSGEQVRILIAAVTLVVGYVAILKYRMRSRDCLAWGLIAAGAASNLLDRFALGGVLDYVDLQVWPVFNLSDVALTCGIALVLLGELRFSRKATT